MRKHIHQCLLNGTFTNFPRRLGNTYQCNKCKEWFHVGVCITVVPEKFYQSHPCHGIAKTASDYYYSIIVSIIITIHVYLIVY